MLISKEQELEFRRQQFMIACRTYFPDCKFDYRYTEMTAVKEGIAVEAELYPDKNHIRIELLATVDCPIDFEEYKWIKSLDDFYEELKSIRKTIEWTKTFK